MTWGQRRAIIIIVLAVFLVILGIFAMKPSGAVRLPTNAVLVIDAAGQIEEQRAPDFFSAFNGFTVPVLHDYLDAIDAAATDPQITGLVVRIAPLETGWGKLEEIRTHLLAFRASDKPSICYLGYDGIGNPEYYLASACQQIWLVPSNPVSIRGMMAEALFFRGTLDKLKVIPEFYHIAEFKTADNMLPRRNSRRLIAKKSKSVLRSIYDQYVNDAAEARGMDRAKFEASLNCGPFRSSDAVTNKIVDRLGYWDQVQDYFKGRAHGWNPISLNRYRSSIRMKDRGQDRRRACHRPHRVRRIATLPAAVRDGRRLRCRGYSRRAQRLQHQSHRVARRFRRRLGGGQRSDSPRSGAGATGKARRRVHVRRRRFRRLLDRYSRRQNRRRSRHHTGSIGVLTGKFNRLRSVHSARHQHRLRRHQRQRHPFLRAAEFLSRAAAYIQKSLNDTYAEFTKGVAKGRKMSVEAVDKIAKGRDWSGAQAKELGLVDELGGLDRAIEIAKQPPTFPPAKAFTSSAIPKKKHFSSNFSSAKKTTT